VAAEDQRRFEGRSAIVTGAGSGIGRATAQVLASEGASVVVNDIDTGRLEETLASLGPGDHRTVVGDIADERTSEALVGAALTAYSRLDVCVGGVGLMHFKDIDEVSVAEFDAVMAVNVRGMFLLCKHAIPPMVKRGAGAVVLVTSTSAFRGQEFDGVSSFVYNTSKAAVRQLATSLATRYGPDGVRVNSVAPGVTRTGQLAAFVDDMSPDQEEETFAGAGSSTPLGRYALPEEVGRAIAFLASDDASYVTGTTLFVDGGMTAT